MIKVVVFDIGGVLIERPSKKRLKFFAKDFGLNTRQKEKVVEAYKKMELKWMKGLIKEKDLISELLKKVGAKAKSRKVWKDYLKKAYKEKKEVIEVVKAIKKAGYKLAILSNASSPDVEYLKEKKFMKLFDYAFFSCELRCAKPEKKIFVKMLRVLGVKTKEIILVDDLKENVIAAKKIGMKAIVFKDLVSLKKGLKHYGIIF
ncbi:MAG: HAD family phosphatase [Candidatus Diapherotrites archaeon]|nr:HAD family phosphatase [Candidatus Diapherotrites archaeon]